MSRVCSICSKGPVVGRTYARRGVAKAKGGVGIKVTRKNPRRFLPNLMRVRALVKGVPQRIRVCTSCLRSGRVVKAP